MIVILIFIFVFAVNSFGIEEINPYRPANSLDSEESILKGHNYSPAKPILIAYEKGEGEEELETEISVESIPDPLEPLNRVFFQFNDKLYFWILKPVSKGYRAVVPELARVGVSNFFHNLSFPIRFVNCFLQGDPNGAGSELTRFMFNTIFGFGFCDFATTELNLRADDEDLGQTLGAYGVNHGFYIYWPVLGASSFRDTFGLVGDSFLDPVNYIVPRTKYNVSVKSCEAVNKTSLTIGDYEDLKDAALDPYIAVRDAYQQYRRNQVKE